MMKIRSCLALLGAVFLPFAAPAATMTFNTGAGTYFDTDGDPFGLDDLYVEDGISVTGFIFGELRDHPSQAAHLDNPGDGHFTDRLIFSFGPRFSLQSLDILPLGFECFLDVCPGYDNVIITGFRNGAVVAESVFSMGFLPSLFAGGQAFSNLDRLMVSTVDGPGDYRFGNTHFEIDNVTLTAAPAPVPLPASLPLLGLGLAVLGLRRLTRRAA